MNVHSPEKQNCLWKCAQNSKEKGDNGIGKEKEKRQNTLSWYRPKKEELSESNSL